MIHSHICHFFLDVPYLVISCFGVFTLVFALMSGEGVVETV